MPNNFQRKIPFFCVREAYRERKRKKGEKTGDSLRRWRVLLPKPHSNSLRLLSTLKGGRGGRTEKKKKRRKGGVFDKGTRLQWGPHRASRREV